MTASTGLLVAIEGAKAVGKSSLIDKLQASPDTVDWVFTKEPSVAFDLNNEQQYRGDHLAELLARDRESHVRDTISPALDEGRVVVTDRYILSGFVFQSIDGVSFEVIAAQNARFPRPDITLILFASGDELRRRKAQEGLETRISSMIDEPNESELYIEYAESCRGKDSRIILGYNETWDDGQLNAATLISAIAARHSSK